ncbi:hypothetical protein SAMN05877809_1203 [Rhodobacter sp. JA431]|uniref:DUF2169 family type VI secretion system accessory protein n=1 Tax=Rhodobacter sp. JA431 TaxID=570013 RepID=UPI000BD688A3|nr:DUF2169 domain-containing protein [Rhodobacter sp. JA431]SOC21948.1 hypothetical protein SAMN05877809_1203 [Rhodobacter sp. JA431]
MLHDNTTPLAAIGFEQWKPDGTRMAVIAARGSFEIDGGLIRYAGKQDLVLADKYEGDPHRTPMVRCSDLIPFKPAADVTVLGAFQAPEPVPDLHAGLRVRTVEKHLRATGPSHWFHQGHWQRSTPEPVTHVALDWRLAAGGRLIGEPEGAVDPRNPIGAGVAHPDYTSEKLTLPAPQIFSEAHPIGPDPTRPSEPEGFGPVSPWWQARARYAGTYDKLWEEQHHPLLPRDFDYRFYQIAPPGLQVPGYLHPGDRVQAYGLLPGAAMLDFMLPDLAPFAKFSFTDGREVVAQLHLDGLHIDLREGVRFDLTWRAWAPICPRFWRIDLDLGRYDEVAAMGLAAQHRRA